MQNKQLLPTCLRCMYIMCLIVCIGAMSSCAYRYTPLITEERILLRHEVRSVAVVPFLVLARGEGDISEASEIFSSELARFREVDIVHPASVYTYLDEHNIILDNSNLIDEALKIGLFFGVDAVFVGTITEYNSFFPPILGLSIMLIDVHSGAVIASKSEVYDSSFNYVRNELKEYAAAKHLEDSLYKEDLILHQFNLYIRFVCNQILKKYF